MPTRRAISKRSAGGWAAPTEGGLDANLEAFFVSARALRPIGSPRPHVGASINTAGQTSHLYFGLSRTGDIRKRVFVEYAFGGSLNNGELESVGGRNALGCHLLFRQSLPAGLLFGKGHSLSLMYDHISNAGFCDENDGQDDLGLRYGHRF